MTNLHHEKLSLLQDLMGLSKADGKVTIEEMQFIADVASRFGVSDNELIELHNNPVDYNPQDRETDRFTQFYRLLLLTSVDANRDENEIEFCKNTGLKMGLNPNAINEVVKRIIASENGTLPVQELIEVFKTNHN